MTAIHSRCVIGLALLGTTLFSGCIGSWRPSALHRRKPCSACQNESPNTVSRSQLARLHRENDKQIAKAAANSPRELDASRR